MDNVNEGYKQLKNDLKEKYSKQIVKAVERIKSEIITSVSQIFGEELMRSFENADKIRDKINKIKDEFYSETEYVELQKKLTSQKEDLKNASESEVKKITEDMRRSLDSISTLNITLRNRLKSYNEQLFKINSFISSELEKNKDEVSRLKDKVLEEIKVEIVCFLNDYNEELSMLNDAFGIENGEPEIPFDEDSVRLDVPIFNFSEYSEDADFADENPYVISENKSSLLN